MSVVIETTIGDITIDLFYDERPRTCMNFLKLCKIKYYNLNLIYSIERNFLAQMGDPSGTGRGGSSIFSNIYGEQARFYEGEKIPALKHKKIGTVSMASCSKDRLFGSQFFITLGENLDSLDEEHLIFGEVTEGLEILEEFNKTLTDDNYRPYQDIRITHTVVIHDPYPDPEVLELPGRSPSPTEAMLDSNYIAVDEEINDNEGRSLEEVHEETAVKEAQARATVLEMVGDLPEADVAPAENVLFVCKLNPVTTSEDLEIIFSRFGKIKSCEIIFDKITKNSLQYGFIEFADNKSCEGAYFKMDNVLIDDRRIHVDFNQSVASLRWKGKGRIEYFDDQGRKTNDPTVFNPNKLSRKGDPKQKSTEDNFRERGHRSPYKLYRYDKDRRNTNHNRQKEMDENLSNHRDSKYKNYPLGRDDYVRDPNNSRYKEDRRNDIRRPTNEPESRHDRRQKDFHRSRDRQEIHSVEQERHRNKHTRHKGVSQDKEKDEKSKVKSRKHHKRSSSSSSSSSSESSDEKTVKLMKKLKKEIKKSKKKNKHTKKKKKKEEI